jgi:hypothetical protein
VSKPNEPYKYIVIEAEQKGKFVVWQSLAGEKPQKLLQLRRIMRFSGVFEWKFRRFLIYCQSFLGNMLILECEKISNFHILHLKVKNAWLNMRKNAGSY